MGLKTIVPGQVQIRAHCKQGEKLVKAARDEMTHPGTLELLGPASQVKDDIEKIRRAERENVLYGLKPIDYWEALQEDQEVFRGYISAVLSSSSTKSQQL